ncbi:MAG TPA: HD domain-containing phosphohydrolase [Gemmatimonadota bacterium]
MRYLTFGLLIAWVAALVLISANTAPDSRTVVGLGVFVLLAILSDRYPLEVPFGKAYLGLSGTVFWALLILFDPVWASTAAFVATIISETIIQHRKPHKALFNGIQTAISVLAGAMTFEVLNGVHELRGSILFFGAFALAALVYWLCNTWLVSLGAALIYSEAPHRFWQRNFQWAFVYELMSAPIALAVAFAYQELWLIGLVLVMLPIMMVRLAYSQYLQLKQTYRETVRTLIKIIEMHDPYTAGHSDRVATYSRQLCEALRLSPTETEKIELAAYLHDLGKIHLDLSGIVRKAGKLTEEERRLVRLHSVVSADLANQVTYFRGEIEAMIRHHHENWDGSGYPHGLQGEQIPLGSRIILLADAFDAMTTSRVYRRALDLDKVKGEFARFAGSQFDPSLVPMFLERVVGEGTSIIKQPIDEPLEGQRARNLGLTEPGEPDVHQIRVMR